MISDVISGYKHAVTQIIHQCIYNASGYIIIIIIIIIQELVIDVVIVTIVAAMLTSPVHTALPSPNQGSVVTGRFQWF